MFSRNRTRRHFLKTLMKGTGSLIALNPLASSLKADVTTLDPRVGLANPYVTPDGRPILVCVNGSDFEQMLTAGLDAIGGLGMLIDNDQEVLIKLNCVVAEWYPTTSDVSSVVSTIEAVGAVSDGVIKVGDAGYQNNQNIYNFLHLEPAVTAAGGELILFTDTYDVRRDTWDPEIPDFEVFQAVYDTPIMICLCNLKRHEVSHFTCALKHHVGSLSGPYLTGTRSYIHSFPDQSLAFLQVVPEIAGLINPELNIVDTRRFWAINGPTSEQGGEVRTMNKIVICGDMVATDAYCSMLMDEYDETYDPSLIAPTFERAEELGLGTSDLNQVEIIEIDATSIDYNGHAANPELIELRRNYPNPFNSTTRIEYVLSRQTRVNLNIYNSLGQKVAAPVNGFQEAGYHRLDWNADNYSSGTYFYEIVAGGQKQSRKMLLLK